MQYFVQGFDGTDAEAPARRLAARPAHVALCNRLRDEGKALYGVALLSDEGQMIGSIYIVDFESRAALDAWLAIEPYVTGEVWQRVEVTPCAVGPSFLG